MSNILPLGAGVMFLGILCFLVWGVSLNAERKFSKLDIYWLMGVVFLFLVGYYLMTLECRPYC